MAVNRYQDHLVILPEDDANRQLANGMQLSLSVRVERVQVQPPSGGWLSVKEEFETTYIDSLRAFPYRRVLLLIDFDGQFERRIEQLRSVVPTDLIDRVYILGCAEEPEFLKRDMRLSYEEIGKQLADTCQDRSLTAWNRAELAHNDTELSRLHSDVEGFLCA